MDPATPGEMGLRLREQRGCTFHSGTFRKCCGADATRGSLVSPKPHEPSPLRRAGNQEAHAFQAPGEPDRLPVLGGRRRRPGPTHLWVCTANRPHQQP